MSSNRLPVILTLTALVLVGTNTWGATARFTPPQQQGDIFAVVNVDRGAGARTTALTVDWGSYHRNLVRANPYGNCAGTLAGFVVMVQHVNQPAVPFAVTTSGRIARPPYQGIAPPEMGHACYELIRLRFR
jgi:hypothetical protein